MSYKPWQHQQKAQEEREVQSRQQAELTTNIASGATISLLFGIVGLLLFGIILGPTAIVLSLGAKGRIRENPELGGGGRATAGLVLGIVDTVLAALGLLLAFA